MSLQEIKAVPCNLLVSQPTLLPYWRCCQPGANHGKQPQLEKTAHAKASLSRKQTWDPET